MRKILMLGFSLFIAAQSVSAASVPLGSGMIGNGTYYPSSVQISLDKLDPKTQYYVNCNIVDPDAKEYPVTATFEISRDMAKGGMVLFDGMGLVGYTATLRDNDTHAIGFPNVMTGSSGKAITMTWKESKGIANPVAYDCSAFD